jgi:putative hydrolase of the HAD superfamily
MAAEKLYSKGIQPVAVLYVGNDMLNDIYPANAIGFQTALFAGDRRSLRLRKDDPRCAALSPDLVVTDLGQLEQYI